MVTERTEKVTVCRFVKFDASGNVHCDRPDDDTKTGTYGATDEKCYGYRKCQGYKPKTMTIKL